MNRISLFLFLASFALVMCTGCGTQQQSGDETKTTSQQPTQVVAAHQEPKDQIVEYRREGDTTAFVARTAAELGECSLRNNSQVAYVTETKTYFACNNSAWIAFTPTGLEKSLPVLPSTEDKTEDTPLADNEWIDPITSSRWLVGSSQEAYAVAERACGGAYRMATRDEITEAGSHGLGVISKHLGAGTSLWTSDLDLESPDSNMWTVSLDPTSEVSAAKSDKHGVVCLKIQE